MKKLGVDEQAKRVQTVRDGNKVVDVVCFVKDEGRDSKVRYQMAFALDFSGASQAELVDLAATTCRIAIQDEWRRSQAKDRFNGALWEKTWNVKSEIIDATRKPRTIDPFAAAMAGLSTFSPEQVAALVKALAEKQQKGKGA